MERPGKIAWLELVSMLVGCMGAIITIIFANDNVVSVLLIVLSFLAAFTLYFMIHCIRLNKHIKEIERELQEKENKRSGLVLAVEKQKRKIEALQKASVKFENAFAAARAATEGQKIAVLGDSFAIYIKEVGDAINEND